MKAAEHTNTLKLEQRSLDTLAKTLIVNYRFLSNIETNCPALNNKPVKRCYGAELILSNPSDNVIFGVDKAWQINFSQVYPTYASASADFNVQHLNGDINQITPTADFAGFKAGQSITIKLWIKSTLISESALMPNYWLAAPNLSPVVIESTKTLLDKDTGLEVQPYVVPFSDTEKQIKLSPQDANAYASPSWLYDHEKALTSTITQDQLTKAIIPTPKSIVVDNAAARLDLAPGIRVSVDDHFAMQDIRAALDRLAFLNISVNQHSESAVPIAIHYSHEKPVDWRAGYYQLSVGSNRIDITAHEGSGAFYALQSLASLITLGSTEIPLVNIVDQPHYRYRGQHVDVGRNFHDKAFIIALIKQMGAYKLNKLHLHLAEDEGWRLAIPSLPELTQVGGSRCMALSDTHCLQPQLGGAGATDRDGYYTVKDYQEILKIAKAHHIQVIPSLDMPGHSRAAIKAMEARYHDYMEQGNEVEAKRYLLTDFDDKTQYSSIQNYSDNTLNICMESTYAFVDRVLEDLKTIHQEAGVPLTLYHIGADETAGAWLESPQCQALIEQSKSIAGKTHLGAHFIERVSHIIHDKGIGVAGWNDGLKETSVNQMPKNVYTYLWDALPWGAHKQLSEQASRNWRVVLSTPDVLYFDFPYQVDPKERGYHWASRRITTRSLFNFMPDNLPVHAEFRVDVFGRHFISDDTVQKDKQGKIKHQPLPKNFTVDGIQGQLWSETVRSEQQAEYMIYPRLLALAERAWHSADWQVPYNYHGKKYDKDTRAFSASQQKARDNQWLLFSHVIGQKELAKLDKAGVFYRVPSPGAKIVSGKLMTNTAIKGLPVEFKEQGKVWQPYQQAVKVTLPVEVRARTADNTRAGRKMVIQP